jgi:hypothetical protein
MFLGESFFARGRTPGAYSEVTGESAFLGWPEANRGVARYADAVGGLPLARRRGVSFLVRPRHRR